MKQLFFGAATLAAIALSGVAGAQYNPTPLDASPHGITLRLGGVFPLDQNLRDVSNSFIGFGAEYTFVKQYMQNSETYLSVDWFGKSSGGEKGNLFPVCINQRFYTGQSKYGDKAGRSYFFVGLGVTFIDAASSATNKIGARAGLGTEIGPSVVAEVAGFVSGKDSGGVAGNAVGVYLGYRFH